MRNYGYMRVGAAVPHVALADTTINAQRICSMIADARSGGCRIVVFPELSITGYTCADLFNQSTLIESVIPALSTIASATSPSQPDSRDGICAIVGAPIVIDRRLYNCAVVCANGNVVGVVPKSHMPNYNEFYERRWFAPAHCLHSDYWTCKALPNPYPKNRIPVGTDLLFRVGDGLLGVEICEDLWVPEPPSGRLAMAGADIIANLSASDENIGKHAYVTELIKQQSARCRSAYIYSSAGRGESSTDLVFSGNAIIAEDGVILTSRPRFSREQSVTMTDIDVEHIHIDRRRFNTFAEGAEDMNIRVIDALPGADDTDAWILGPQSLMRRVERYPFVDSDPTRLDEGCAEIISIQTWGLMQRLEATRCKNLVIGISGGLDSTLALLVAVRAFDQLGLDRKGILGITMPGFGTTTRTRSNASKLMDLLGVTSMEIPIADAVDQHFKDIDQSKEVYDATYENGQARERTQILMDMANKHHGMVLGTGDLSELALGWCTYNGDHMSMYGVNSSIPKTLVKHLVKWFASKSDPETSKVLMDIVDTPISPELIPASDGADTIEQKTEDLVGPYELHDFFLFHTLRNGYSPTKIFMLARKAFEKDYDTNTLKKWLRNFYRRFFNQQFKRSCMPDGPKVGSVCLSPRGDWRMPSDAISRLWLAEVDTL